MTDIKSETYLIPFEQVVCDFGSVVAWRLWTTGKRTKPRRQDKRERISQRLKTETDKIPAVFLWLASYPVWVTYVTLYQWQCEWTKNICAEKVREDAGMHLNSTVQECKTVSLLGAVAQIKWS